MTHTHKWRQISAAFLFVSAAANLSAASLKFTDGGDIVGVGGRISLSQSGEVSIATSTGDMFNLTVPVVVKGGKTHWNMNDLSNRSVKVDAAKKEAVFTGTVEDPALPTPLTVHYSVALLPEDKARISLRYDGTEPVSKYLGLTAIFFYTKRAPAVGSEVTVDGLTTPIGDTPRSDRSTPLTKSTHPADIVFYSNDPYRTLAVHVVKASLATATDENLNAWQSIGSRIFLADNEAIVDVTLPDKAKATSAETYAGLDFDATEHIHMPQYNACRNLVQNPGFEHGFQYWTFGNLGSDKGNRFPDNYVIDTTQAVDGKRCLKILVEKGERPAPLASFAIPVEKGQEYTLSFSAKAELPNMAIDTTVFGGGDVGWSPNWKTLAISQQWKRYNYTFKAPTGAMAVEFGCGGRAEDSAVYLDDVQLEKGPLTDFASKPLQLSFVTDHRDNLFKPGDPIHGRWEITGQPGASGKIQVALKDFQGVTLKERTELFKLANDGTATLSLPWIEHADRGLYTLEASVKTADGNQVRENGRLSVMPPADPTIKHHTLLAAGYFSTQFGSWDRIASGLEYFGIGSVINFDPPTHAALAVLAKHNLLNVSQIYGGSDVVGKIGLKDGWNGTDADLPILEEDAYRRAKEYPEIAYWKMVNEPGGDLVANADSMKRWIRALTATYIGIKRANPKAHVFTVDPANISPNNGTALVDNYLTCGGGAIADLAAIHPYCGVPEPQDAAIATFIAMLDRHKFPGDVWFTEGGDFCDVNVPGLVTGADNWRIGHFAYDIGDGERRTAAFQTRLWLIGLKYGNRVKQQVDWSFDAGTMDYDNTPTARAFAVNTLADVLGNADFVKDIPLGPNERCYLFKDAKQRPVAAIWNADPLTHGVKPLPLAKVRLGAVAKSLDIINMVGTKVAADPSGDLAVTPFPVLLRGEPGSADKLASTIAKGFEASAVGAVVGYAVVKDAAHVGIELRNTTAKPVRGVVNVTGASAPKQPLTIEVASGKTSDIVLPFATPPTGIRADDMAIKWTPEGSSATQTFPAHVESLACPRVKGPLAINGDIAAWKAAGANVFAIPQRTKAFNAYPPNPKYPNTIPWGGTNDLSATMALAYDTGTLYLGFDITDDCFAPAATVASAWQGDGMQIYFDPWQAGHALIKAGAQDEDQELDIWPGSDPPTVYRAVKPGFQIAFTKLGVVPAIKSSLTKRPGGYVIQLAIPETELAPLALKPGAAFGLSFIINDSDGEFRKRGLTLTPEGTEPFMHPELFPAVVLGM